MAWDPCVSCGAQFHGATAFTYVTWHVGEQRLAYRLRQCAACAAELRNLVAERGDSRGETGDWAKSPMLEAVPEPTRLRKPA